MMMTTLRRRVLFLAAIILAWNAIHPGVASAQTSGVGGDGITRILWRGTDGKISVWKLDGSLNGIGAREYGPLPGWTPVAMTVGANNNSYILWRHSSGWTSIWRLDADLNQLGAPRVEQPYDGWSAETLSTGPGSQLRIIWRHSTGKVSVWALDASMASGFAKEHGPYFGWDPGPR
jgi:hypothetical protein